MMGDLDWQSGIEHGRGIPGEDRIFHPTYLRLRCLHVRCRGALLPDVLARSNFKATFTRLYSLVMFRSFLRSRKIVAEGGACCV
jgi:hypothetical protein